MRIGITRKFLLFFFFTAMLPILVFAVIFIHTTNTKFDLHSARLLDAATRLALQLQHDDLRKIELLSSQAALLAISEKYHQYRQNGDPTLLETLNKYQRNKGLHLVTLIDTSDKLVASTQQPETLDPKSLKMMMQDALHGKAISSIEAFRDQKENLTRLAYVSVVPLRKPTKRESIIGVLLTGKYIHTETSLEQIPHILPAVKVTLFTRQNGKNQLIFTTFSPQEQPDSSLIPAEPGDASKGQPVVYERAIHGKIYKNRMKVLTNYRHQPVGTLVLSTQDADEVEVKNQTIMYMAFYILVGLGLLGLIGAWFQKTFVNPIEQLSNVAERVTQGELGIRVPHRLPQQEIAKTLDNFNRMLDKLQENEKIRSTFVSTLTHDLRTPLIAQKRALEIFEKESARIDNTDLTTLSHSLSRSNNNLLDLVNTLLETYQYEEGKITLILETVNLHELLDDCISQVADLASSKQITIENALDSNMPRIMGDRFQLKRVFLNLLGNAVENIRVGESIWLTAQEDVKIITISVADNGPGIEAERLAHLFQRYSAVHRNREKIGSGLGLYICKMILDLHGATIQAESSPGEGTRFNLGFPKRSVE